MRSQFWCWVLLAHLLTCFSAIFSGSPASAGSIEEWQADLASHPMRTNLRLRLAAALEDAGRFEEALAEFRTIAKAEPENPVPWLKIGLIERLVFGRNREALGALQRTLALDPTIDAAWYYLGLTAGDLASYSTAVSALEEAMRRQPPGHPVGRDYLQLYCAILELADRRPDAARQRLPLLRSANPGFAATLETLLAQVDE